MNQRRLDDKYFVRIVRVCMFWYQREILQIEMSIFIIERPLLFLSDDRDRRLNS